MKNVLSVIILIFTTGFFVLGCSPETSSITIPTPVLETPSTPPENMIPGMGKFSGIIIDSETDIPLVLAPLFLAKVIRDAATNEGVFALDTGRSPFTESNLEGEFVFTNVEPGEYVLVVGSAEINQYAIVQDTGADTPVIYMILADQSSSAGSLPIPGLEIYRADRQNPDPYPPPASDSGYPDPNS